MARSASRRVGAGIVTLALLIVPGAASAATVASNGATITYQATGNRRDVVGVRWDAARGKFLIREDYGFDDPSSPLTPGPGCTSDPDAFGQGQFSFYAQVACGGPATTAVNVGLGEGEDYLLIDNALPATLTGFGGPARDALIGGPGREAFHGGAGGDELEGGPGADTLISDEGSGEAIFGYASSRFTFGQTAKQFNAAAAADGGDTLVGGNNVGTVDGQGGADVIRPEGQAIVDGGPGRDNISGKALRLRASVDGGADDDKLTHMPARADIHGGGGNDVIKGVRGTQVFGDGGKDKITGAGNVDGGPGRDTIRGSKGADNLFGNTGNDLILGLGGDDDLDGSTGDDRALGGAGGDDYAKTFHSGGCGGNDFFDGQAGHDTAFLSCGLLRLRLRDGGRDDVSCRVPAPDAIARILSRDRADRVDGCR
jgi:Ca2+-binding RTX toxin-like protein